MHVSSASCLTSSSGWLTLKLVVRARRAKPHLPRPFALWCERLHKHACDSHARMLLQHVGNTHSLCCSIAVPACSLTSLTPAQLQAAQEKQKTLATQQNFSQVMEQNQLLIDQLSDVSQQLASTQAALAAAQGTPLAAVRVLVTRLQIVLVLTSAEIQYALHEAFSNSLHAILQYQHMKKACCL